jgi:hypothetical protein
LRITCASPRSIPNAAAGSIRASMHVTDRSGIDTTGDAQGVGEIGVETTRTDSVLLGLAASARSTYGPPSKDIIWQWGRTQRTQHTWR